MTLRPMPSPYLRTALALGGLLALAACSKPAGQTGAGASAAPAGKSTQGPGGAAARGPVEFPVEVEPVESRTVEYAVSAVGSVEAFETVAVTARVAGVVEQVRFAEGILVGAGQSLVDIEPRR